MTCGRSFVEQQIVIANNSDRAWCVQPGTCGENKLLRIVDESGQRVAYGLSCGRLPSALNSLKSRLARMESISPGKSRGYPYGWPAVTYPDDLDDPREFNLTQRRSYTGSTAVVLADCDRARTACANDQCEWTQLVAIGVIRVVELRDVAIPFGGTSCPKGFDPYADFADPPGNPFDER